MTTCYVCQKELIKQPLVGERVLSEKEKKWYELSLKWKERTLECSVCGSLCYRCLSAYPSPDGYGRCTACDGKDVRKRPLGYIEKISYILIWSCPVHGSSH
jgi:hypothetical protein